MAKQVRLLRNLSLTALAMVITLLPAVSVIAQESITLTTIMPDQDTLRVVRGAVGDRYRDSTTYPDAVIGDDNLIIEGRVGIGTPNPAFSFDARGANANTWNKPTLGVSDGDEGFVMLFGNAAGSGPAIIWDSDDRLRFGIGGSSMTNPDASWTERMTILSNGNVGIGTSSPTSAAAPNGRTTENLDVNDVWLRGANAGAGGWASAGGGVVANYVSGWQFISMGANVNFAHPLGTDKLVITVQFKPTLTGTVTEASDSAFAWTGYGCHVTEITSTNVRVSGGSGRVEYWKSGGTTSPDNTSTTGYVRVVLLSLS